eukprot:15458556-Alexandrium_andersonii.AAC.1
MCAICLCFSRHLASVRRGARKRSRTDASTALAAGRESALQSRALCSYRQSWLEPGQAPCVCGVCRGPVLVSVVVHGWGEGGRGARTSEGLCCMPGAGAGLRARAEIT